MTSNDLWPWVERLNSRQTLLEIQGEIERIGEALGASHVFHVFGRLAHDAHNYEGTAFREAPICVNRYPEEWRSIYFGQGLHRTDPVAREASRSPVPILWHRTGLDPQSSASKGFFGSIGDVRLRAGITVPSHGPASDFGMLSLSFDSSSKDVLAHVEAVTFDAQVLAAYIHANIDRVLRASSPAQSDAARLTPREREILRWTASGKTAWEISSILSISERTARDHLERIVMKLGARNKFQAVAQAVANGLTRL